MNTVSLLLDSHLEHFRELACCCNVTHAQLDRAVCILHRLRTHFQGECSSLQWRRLLNLQNRIQRRRRRLEVTRD